MKLSARVSKFFIALLSLILTFSGVVSPVQAVVPALGDGFYFCTNGQVNSQGYNGDQISYEILDGVVFGNDCYGAVVIAEGVTGIDDAAFYGAALTSITFPASLTTIGIEAFAAATQLQTVSFAQGSQLTTIGNSAFDGAVSLTSITIPAGVTTIGEGAFYDADTLTSITIPASVSTIGFGAFFGADLLTSITVDPSNTAFTSIDGVLFNELTTTLIYYPWARSEATYSIPTGVTTIADGAFYDSDYLTSINIPASVTTIGDYVFEDAESLLDFNFWGNAPDSLSEFSFEYTVSGAKAHIKENATGFGATGETWPQSGNPNVPWPGLVVEPDLVGDGSYVCTTGERLTRNDTSPFYEITNGVVSAGEGCAGEVVIRDGAVWIGSSAFYGAGLESVAIPKSVTSIGIWAFCETTATSINVDTANNHFASAYGVLLNKDLSTLIAYPSGSYLANYSVPTSVLTISDSAFYKSLYLESVHIPNSVTDIHDYAFADSPELETITFSAESPITKVKNETFSGLPKLSSITIPEGVTSIEDNAFSNTTSLTDVNFLGDAPTVAAGAFSGIFSGATAYVKSTATGFGDTGDLWNGLLVEANLVVDGYYACASGLPSESSDSSLAYTVTNKVVLAGTGCTGPVVIPAGVKEIGGYAFNSSGITSISLPAGLKKIGNGAFESATSLSSITIPASVQSIGQFAFYYAQSLETVSISQGSQLTSIGASAFSRVPALTSITIPASVTTIGISAFAVSAALMEVNFLGNTPTVGSNAFSRVASGAKAKIGYSATGFGDTGDLWNGLLVEANLVFDGDYVCTTGELRSQNDTSAAYTVINYVVTDGWDCGGAVVITEGVTSIGSSAFDKYYDAQTITSITIPATVTSLQETAFWGQELLSEVNFVGNAPSSVGIEVFQNVAAGAKAYITASATGFGTGTTWNGLVIDRAASVSAPVTNSPTTSSPVTNSPTTNTPVANTPTTSTPDTTTPVTTVPTTFAVTSYEVRFAAGSSVITQAHNNLIKKIVSKSGKSATFTVTGVAAKVVGVADSLAKVMAKARAEKIKTYLMKLGVRKSNILTKIKIVNSGVTPKTSILAKRAKP